MRIKPLFLVALMITIYSGTFSRFTLVSSSPATEMVVDPPINYALAGETFTTNVMTLDVQGLYSWQVNMSFDPTLLEFVNVTEGDFLKDQPEGTKGFIRINNTRGWALFGWTTFGKYQGVSGSGTLATVEFQVRAAASGESVLNITKPNTFMLKWNPPPVPPGGTEFEDIPTEIENGFFTNIAVPPAAEFIYSPTQPAINETITFDASNSSVVAPLEIVRYEWDFGDGTNQTSTDATAQHTFTTGGSYDVALTVIDNASASALMQLVFNTTEMPSLWYQLFGSTSQTIHVAFSHDIAIADVTVSDDEVAAGTTITISANVTNLGAFTETFDVVASYDTTTIDTQSVTALNPDAHTTVTLSWDTSGVAEGTYQITVEAINVQGDGNLVNNKKILGHPVVITATSGAFPTTLVLAAVGIVAVAGVGAFWLLRRRSAQPPA